MLKMRSPLCKTWICLFLAAQLLFFVSCERASVSGGIAQIDGLSFERTIPLEYAREFRIDEYRHLGSEIKSYKLVTVSGSDRYLFIPENAPVPENLPPDMVLIFEPAENIFLCASSAMSLWTALGSLDKIRFSSIQKKGWYLEDAVRAMEDGSILYAGKYSSPDFELLLERGCRLAIESTMIYHVPQVKEKLESLGIPVFVDKSSYEENPLGRLEWIKLYGLFAGKEMEAESFFDAQIKKLGGEEGEGVLSDYRSGSPKKKVAFFYMTANGTVSIRGNDDYIVKMIEMAGGEYAFAEARKSSSPSVTVSMEQFFAECADADFLIYNSSIDGSLRSKSDLLSKSPLFSEFKAFQRGDVWTTGHYLYQATARIGDMILDIKAVLAGEGDKAVFLEKLE